MHDLRLLLEQFLHDKAAAEKPRGHSQLRSKYFAYKKAYEAMKSSTVILHKCGDARKIAGVGPKIVEYLEQQYQEHISAGRPIPTNTEQRSVEQHDSSKENDKEKEVKKSYMPYVPEIGSPGYEVLMALRQLAEKYNPDEYFNKKAVIELCSLPKEPDMVDSKGADGFTLLIESGLVEHKRRKHFRLTALGSQVALGLSCPATAHDDLPIASFQRPKSLFRATQLEVKDFDVILVLDVRERYNNDRTWLQRKLECLDISVETRALQLGDMLWIARAPDGTELILDCIIERKCMADLVSSIHDGRYREQKSRLGRCGLSRVVYLVEGEHQNLAAVRTALSSVQLLSGFFLKETSSAGETVDYLAQLTWELKRRYRDCARGPSFAAFQAAAKKTGNSVYETNVRMLSAIQGVSVSKAVSLLGKYGTVGGMKNTLELGLAEQLVNNTPVGKRRVGPALAQRIYQVFTQDNVL